MASMPHSSANRGTPPREHTCGVSMHVRAHQHQVAWACMHVCVCSLWRPRTAAHGPSIHMTGSADTWRGWHEVVMCCRSEPALPCKVTHSVHQQQGAGLLAQLAQASQVLVGAGGALALVACEKDRRGR